MMKKVIPLFMLMFLIGGCAKAPSREIGFFFLETCPGCESYERAGELNGLVILLNGSGEYSGRGWNMAFADPEGNETLSRMIEERGLPDLSYALPLLFIGDEYFVGYDDIEAELTGRAALVREK
ncbi:MAG: hypothetical protein PQJ60_05710 [Spirochaetales bacterium]|nr:hypothetical protein [Spirochaetales bacterium]